MGFTKSNSYDEIKRGDNLYQKNIDSLADLNALELGTSIYAPNIYDQRGPKDRELENLGESHLQVERIRFHSPQNSNNNLIDFKKNLSNINDLKKYTFGASQDRWNASFLSGVVPIKDLLSLNSTASSSIFQRTNFKAVATKEQYKSLYNKHSNWLKDIKSNVN